jgi:transcriptional regulator with XRE-family HTH domain
MSDTTAFARRLKIAREKTGKTQRAIGVLIGRSDRQISEWENGGGLAPILQKLEELQIIHINDGSCTCTKNDTADVTSTN